jgi:transcriptional regulator with XRE-family HTH domain
MIYESGYAMNPTIHAPPEIRCVEPGTPRFGSTRLVHISHLHPLNPIVVPSLGLTAPGTGNKKMIDTKFDSLAPNGLCKVQSLDSWVAKLADPVREYYIRRSDFLGDIGYAMKLSREAANLNRRELSALCGLSRVTILEIESGRSKEGNRLSVLVRYMAKIDGALTFTATPYCVAPGEHSMRFVLSNDPGTFAARAVRAMRKHAGFSQAELGRRIHLPKAIQSGKDPAELCRKPVPTSSTMISRIEKGTDNSSMRTGTLYNVAQACGLTLRVDLPDTGGT